MRFVRYYVSTLTEAVTEHWLVFAAPGLLLLIAIGYGWSDVEIALSAAGLIAAWFLLGNLVFAVLEYLQMLSRRDDLA